MTALNLWVKPMSDSFFMLELPPLVKASGDHKLEEMFLLLDEDCVWHREWSAALVSMALRERPENRAALTSWAARWLPRAEDSIESFSDLFPDGGSAAVARARRRTREWLERVTDV
jgi:hypothetical protein